MGDIGFSELLVIIIVAILCFGKDLPMVARKAGRFIQKARRYLLDIKDEVQRQIPLDDFDLSRDVKQAVHETTALPEPAPTPPAPAEPAAETCPICGEGLKEPIAKCAKCSKSHHQGCWNYSGTCGIAECGGKETTPPAAA